MPPNSYLICGTPRTGSTLLCGLLQSTGIAGVPESYFRLPDEQSWADRWQLGRDPQGAFDYSDYMRAAVGAGSTDNRIFGARVMWGTMDKVVARLGAVHPDLAGEDLKLLTRVLGPTRFVHLWRDDTVAQAASWVRAEQTQYWQDGNARPPGHEPYFDADAIAGCVRTIDQHNAAWRDWFAAFDVQPYAVRYEDLTGDNAGATRGLLDFLGLDPPVDQTIRAGHRRQADQINHDWVTRFRATVRPD